MRILDSSLNILPAMITAPYSTMSEQEQSAVGSAARELQLAMLKYNRAAGLSSAVIPDSVLKSIHAAVGSSRSTSSDGNHGAKAEAVKSSRGSHSGAWSTRVQSTEDPSKSHLVGPGLSHSKPRKDAPTHSRPPAEYAASAKASGAELLHAPASQSLKTNPGTSKHTSKGKEKMQEVPGASEDGTDNLTS
ncbi:hypothetical protein R1sor_020926 [Riccia sorocarpa]|uniref:Uncharacterized protein n=1 Tax=Riccia sorocarpa TaxID=122646 RepID=A0ABD3GFK2_9MARC